MVRDMAFIVVKAPVPGQVKSRLAFTVGDEVAASLYRSMSARIVKTFVGAGIPLTIAYHPPDSERMIKEVYGDDIPLIPQRGSDLGERLKNAFKDLLSDHERVVAISSDVPEIEPKTVIDALASLHTSDAVIGPCPDGGFYLIGFTAASFREEAFEGIPWSTEVAAVSVLWKLKGLHVSLLPELNDIDSVEDLIDMIRRFEDE
jgi:rSAM/selenodomain-associated transferase 1